MWSMERWPGDALPSEAVGTESFAAAMIAARAVRP